MGKSFIIATSSLLIALTPIPAVAADVTVTFVKPEAYIDAGHYGDDVAHNLLTLERYLTQLGSHCLGDGQSLDLRVLNVDLAGREEWWRGSGYDLRVMREITWPRVDLAYVWRDATGQVLGEGEARIVDLSYLSRSAYLRTDTDELPYEKAMLRDWFGRNLCRGRS